MNASRRNRRNDFKKQFRDTNPKDQLVGELVGIVKDGGTIDREDAELLIEKIKEDHK